MLKTYLYLPEELHKEINMLVSTYNMSKAETIRQALEKGITVMQKQKIGSAQSLLRLAEIGKKFHLKGPRDSSARIDELLWGKDWSKDE